MEITVIIYCRYEIPVAVLTGYHYRDLIWSSSLLEALQLVSFVISDDYNTETHHHNLQNYLILSVCSCTLFLEIFLNADIYLFFLIKLEFFM